MLRCFPSAARQHGNYTKSFAISSSFSHSELQNRIAISLHALIDVPTCQEVSDAFFMLLRVAS
jgi:hypothetical protein